MQQRAPPPDTTLLSVACSADAPNGLESDMRDTDLLAQSWVVGGVP